MKKLYRSSLILFLLTIVACTSLSKSTTLQVIDFMEPGYFLEGAKFNLSKQKEGCLLEGVGYGETGQNQYELYFNQNGLTAVSYTSYRYQGFVYDVNSDVDGDVDGDVERIKVEELNYGENSEEDESILKLFIELTRLITADNLSRCR